MSFLRKLFGSQRASATIEFAFASIFLFGTLMVALDFGYYAQQRMRLGQAVEQAAVLAYNQQTTADTSAISTYLIAASGTKTAPTVAITCNGTATCGNGKCSCVDATGGFTLAATCNATCSASSAISGNYMKIVAATTYSAVIVPDKWLGGTAITSAAVIRLQ